MTTQPQPEALRLAQALNNRQECEDDAADMLRALHAECEALRADAERWRFATSDYAEEHTDIAVCKAFAAVFGVDANDVVDAAIDAARAAKEQA